VRFVSSALVKDWAKDLSRASTLYSTVFCDPPYSKGLANKTFIALGSQKLWTPGAIWVQEKFKKDPALNDPPTGWSLLERRERGDSALELFVFQPTTTP
jgi:16S rRNA G966 N2-methylase RsmD